MLPTHIRYSTVEVSEIRRIPWPILNSHAHQRVLVPIPLKLNRPYGLEARRGSREGDDPFA